MAASVIAIGLGSNLSGPTGLEPQQMLDWARYTLTEHDIIISRVSPYYRSAPIPASKQPDYVNAVAIIETELSPDHLLRRLHEVESQAGRLRGEINAARSLDLDLIAYHASLIESAPFEHGRAIVPHPRMHERAFVLLPLRDVAPDWRHPRTRRTVQELIDALPPGQRIERIPASA